MSVNAERFERQHDLINQKDLSEKKILVVGVGAVGRQVALSLAAMGAKNVTICDMDVVDLSNIATQAYPSSDVGEKKVVSLFKYMKGLDHEKDALFKIDDEQWNPKKYRDNPPDIIFSCVDMMNVRRALFLFAKSHGVDLFIDGRMLAEMGHVFCYRSNNIDEYEKTLFSDEKAIPGRCTARSTLYMANILANLMIGKMALALRGFTPTPKYTFNLTGELI